MEWWSHFVDLLANNVYFRSGFLWGLIAVGVVWLLWGLFFRLYVQWLKMRQFFEPIKRPGRTPVETGPSPASIMLGCLWRIIVTVVVVVIGIVLLIWVLGGLYR